MNNILFEVLDAQEEDSIGSSMRLVAEKCEQVSIESFLMGVYHKLKSEEEVRKCNREVEDCVRKMQYEYERMDAEKTVFLRSIATRDNKCYDSCRFLAGKLRGSMSGAKKVFKKFHIRARAHDNRLREMNGGDKRSEYESSYLSQPATSCMFGLQSYPECVRVLFDNMMLFNGQLKKVYLLIHEVVRREEEIRNDHEMCYELLKDFLRSSRTFLATINNLNDVNSENVVCENSIVQMRDEHKADDEFASALYHNVTPDALLTWVLREMCRIKEAKGLTEVEQYLWGQDEEKVKRIRCAIENFDSLLPKDVTIRNNKLPAKYVAMFMYWCGITNKKTESVFIDYFNGGYVEKGMYQTILYNAVNNAKNKIINMKSYKEYILFEKCLISVLKGKLSA